MRCVIRLPWPPSVNSYWRSIVIGGSPRVLLSRDGRAYRESVQAAVWERWGVLRPLECRLSVSLFARPPDRRSRDLDNLLKGPLDALTHAKVWADDSLLDRITIERGPVVKGGELVVTIERIDDGRPVQRELGLAKREDVA